MLTFRYCANISLSIIVTKPAKRPCLLLAIPCLLSIRSFGASELRSFGALEVTKNGLKPEWVVLIIG